MRTLSLVGLMVLLLCPSALRAQFVYGNDRFASHADRGDAA